MKFDSSYLPSASPNSFHKSLIKNLHGTNVTCILFLEKRNPGSSGEQQWYSSMPKQSVRFKGSQYEWDHGMDLLSIWWWKDWRGNPSKFTKSTELAHLPQAFFSWCLHNCSLKMVRIVLPSIQPSLRKWADSMNLNSSSNGSDKRSRDFQPRPPLPKILIIFWLLQA